VTGTPDRDATAIAAVDAGAQHGRKWPPEPTSRHAVRQGVRIRVFENSDPSEQAGLVTSDGADRRFHLFCEGCSAAKHGSLGPRFDPLPTTFLALGAYKKKSAPLAEARGAAKKVGDKTALDFTPVLRLEPTSTSWLRDPFTAVLEAPHMNVMV
jgi:hypothetical protein